MLEFWARIRLIIPSSHANFHFQVADKLEVLPGSEFRVAFEEAMSYGAKVILGDRPVQVRFWNPHLHSISYHINLYEKQFKLL